MFSWLGDLIQGLGGAVGGVFDTIGEQVSTAIWDTMLTWLYNTIFGAVSDFFALIGGMGADIFTLEWVQATIKLFTLLAWTLYAAGTAVAVFHVAMEYQQGRASIQATALNVLVGFFGCSLIGVLPVELYTFCVSLQNTFTNELAALFTGSQTFDLPTQSVHVLDSKFIVRADMQITLLLLLSLIAFAYCVIKIFFANIKRGGILLIQIAVGSLYLFSVPRGYTDGFYQWCKQVIAICLSAFLQTTLLYISDLNPRHYHRRSSWLCHCR